MFDLKPISSVNVDDLYAEIAQQLTGLLAGERDGIANAANMSALIFTSLPDLNWAGFYFLQGDTLVLGPFQGRPACVRIEMGKGVCGTAAATRQTQRVRDVNDFPGHIACDAASRSELVVPLIHEGRVIGVLDLDSPIPARFTQKDQDGIESLAGIFMAGSSFA
ncbi:MAG: GAF domain-containing protein [Alphaproteobacteria bacterium]|nr:GAF domain-containing protein [Alphaproteobacteria bacterium]